MALNKEVYKFEPDKILKQLKSNKENGLNSGEAKKRLSEYGPNFLKRHEPVSLWNIFVDQFKNILVLLLLFASGISFFIGERIEGVAVLAVILINALFGFLTEYKAERSVETLREMVTTEAKVIRDGEIQKVNSEDVVPGDLLVFQEGDRITADARLMQSENLAVDESTLTGESEPVSKTIEVIADDQVPLAERKNMVFMGTAVTSGNGTAIVTATGSETQMGQISNLLRETKNESTPLEQKLDEMGKSLIWITLLVAGIVTLVGIITGREVLEMLKTGTALAIAAVPEGLPAVATITLAIGMNKMAKNNALVKSLPSVETLGSTTVICTDKTGTLTENQMTVAKIALIDKEVTVTGTGYKPQGEFRVDNRTLDVSKDDVLELFLTAGTLCSNAEIVKDEEIWQVVGDPTEGALVSAASKAKLERQELEEAGYKRTEEIPFTSVAKYMAVSYQNPDGEYLVFLKGAPSVVLSMSDTVATESGLQNLNEDLRTKLKQKNEALAKEGLRVLAVAYKQKREGSLEENIKSGMVFLGFAGILDPPREGVKQVLDEAHNAGIRTLMITGDQSDTAIAIGQRVNIVDGQEQAVTGAQMDSFSSQELQKKIRNHSVFARVSPKNKLDIVEALNRQGEITAMTGDGVNDAPALKKADIGVAMGKRGTAVAKEAADMILLDDSFATIVESVKRGRVIFDNIQKFVHYLFSCNLSEILLIFFSILLRIPTPLLALQILWLNLVTDVFPALVLGWEPPEAQVMEQPPRNPEQSILTNSFKAKIGLQALVITMGPLLTYLYALNRFGTAESRTIAFMTLAFVQLLHVFDVRRKNGLGLDATLLENKYLWGAIMLTIALQLFAIYTPFMRTMLHTKALSLTMWGVVAVGSIAPVLILQAVALIKNR